MYVSGIQRVMKIECWYIHYSALPKSKVPSPQPWLVPQTVHFCTLLQHEQFSRLLTLTDKSGMKLDPWHRLTGCLMPMCTTSKAVMQREICQGTKMQGATTQPHVVQWFINELILCLVLSIKYEANESINIQVAGIKHESLTRHYKSINRLCSIVMPRMC
jgi:hypothetical protein